MAMPAVLPDPQFFLAQTSREMVDDARLSEMERLRNGGRHDESGDFIWYVLVPMGVLLCLIVLGRRLMS